MSGTQPTYEVYLTASAEESAPEIESPISTDRIDFYDSGVWVSREMGRDFFPYERIQVIREGVDEAESESTEAESESTEAESESTEAESEPTEAERADESKAADDQLGIE